MISQLQVNVYLAEILSLRIVKIENIKCIFNIEQQIHFNIKPNFQLFIIALKLFIKLKIRGGTTNVKKTFMTG